MIVKEGEYKGNKTISLLRDEEDRFPFSFGVTKAGMILEALPEIQEFYNKYNKNGGK
jgi:hypothetical protein